MTLCGTSFSKSTVSELCKALDPVVSGWNERTLKEKRFPFVIVDAMQLKIRQQGRVVPQSALIAVGVNEEGYREVLGLMIGDSESEATWSEFFRWLTQRGLRNAPDLQTARALLDDIVTEYAPKAPRAAACLETGFDDAMAVMALPDPYRRRLRSTNGLQRLNREVRRRERVIGIFPNAESALRLLREMLMEQDEEWTTGRLYFRMDQYWECKSPETKDESSGKEFQKGAAA